MGVNCGGGFFSASNWLLNLMGVVAGSESRAGRLKNVVVVVEEEDAERSGSIMLMMLISWSSSLLLLLLLGQSIKRVCQRPARPPEDGHDWMPDSNL